MRVLANHAIKPTSLSACVHDLNKAGRVPYLHDLKQCENCYDWPGQIKHQLAIAA